MMQRAQVAGPRVFGPFLDLVVLTATYVFTVGFRDWLHGAWAYDLLPGDKILQPLPVQMHLILGVLVVPAWLFCLRRVGSYSGLRKARPETIFFKILRATAMGTLAVIGLLFVTQLTAQVSRSLLVLFPLFSVVTLFLTRMGMLAYQQRVGWDRHNILIIGAAREAEPLIEALQRHSEWGFRVIGVMHPGAGRTDTDVGGRTVKVLGRLDQLPAVLEQNPVHQVFLTGRTWDTGKLRWIADCCEEVGVELSMDANFLGLRVAHAELQHFDGWSVLSFASTSTNGEAMAMKRMLDVLGAGLGLLALAPLLGLAALAVKLEDPKGPVFFGQERSGLFGQPFTMWKFRSMVTNAEELKGQLAASNEMDGPVFKIKKDPRITRVGALLRKTSIDELPQLWNVFVGEMSLVGPRPPIPSEVAEYERWQMRRLSMRPGITCIWQVSGRNDIDFETWMKLDLEYIDNWSFLLDVKLLLKTIPVVVVGAGAS